MSLVRVQAEPFDTGAEIAGLHGGRPDIGAVVSFTGYCRGEAGSLAALELEHFPGMAESEMERILGEAEARWPLLGSLAVHRFGVIHPSEPIVLVAAASAHRGAAFAAAEFVMDFLKTDAPFWKREHRTGEPQTWVTAKNADDHARARWEEQGSGEQGR